MTDKEILQKAIEKTEKNGYNQFCDLDVFLGDWDIDEGGFMNGKYGYFHIGGIIFNLNFAKAFFGEELINIDFKQTIIENNQEKIVNIILQEKAWRFHISEMVKCEEPLKYLEKFL